jgi:hypothetical protein
VLYPVKELLNIRVEKMTPTGADQTANLSHRLIPRAPVPVAVATGVQSVVIVVTE